MSSSQRNKKVPAKNYLIFDMDGTLYNFKSGSFSKSELKEKVVENARNFIANQLNESAENVESIMREIKAEYGQEISVALEDKYGIDRYDYFNTVWDISPADYIEHNPGLRDKLLELKDDFEFLLISDAPRIWVRRVLEFLNVYDLFENNIITGESEYRKSYHNIHEKVLMEKGMESEQCIALGDQEDTDITPAKKLGMSTVYVGEAVSEEADYTIPSVMYIKEAIDYTLGREQN